MGPKIRNFQKEKKSIKMEIFSKSKIKFQQKDREQITSKVKQFFSNVKN